MITLRSFQTEDEDPLIELANNPNVSKFLHPIFPYPYDRDVARWWIETGWREDGKINRAIAYNGVLVGCVGLNRQPSWKSHTAELGYWLGEPYWGRGITTAAVQLLIEYAFNHTNIEKIFSTVLHENLASLRILEKLGFQREGILQKEVYKNGSCYDIHHYALLKYQFTEIKDCD